MFRYKKIIPLAFVALMATGVYQTVDNSFKQQEIYKENLDEARRLAKLGIIEDSIKYYDLAREYDDSLEINFEEASMLIDNSRIDQAIDFAKEIENKFDEEPKAYEYLMNIYVSQENYIEAFKTFDRAQDKNVVSKNLDSLYTQIEYSYRYALEGISDVGSESNANRSVAIQRGGYWEYVTTTGYSYLSDKYASAGLFVMIDDNTCVAPIEKENEGFYYITHEGQKKFVVQNLEGCDYLGYYDGAVLVAHSAKGYGLYDIDFNCIIDGYDYITNMSGGIGATNKDGEWHIVSSNGKPIVDEAYDDVIIDDKFICFRNSRVFVKKAGKCYMLDETGNKIKTEVQLEDAYPFLEENGLAAVKVNGKWGFMDKDGKMIIKPRYKNAKSFKNGYAAVSKAGSWGFIDSDNKLVFDYIFQEVKDFTSAGTVFVKEYGEWKLMVLYKFNHN